MPFQFIMLFNFAFTFPQNLVSSLQCSQGRILPWALLLWFCCLYNSEKHVESKQAHLISKYLHATLNGLWV